MNLKDVHIDLECDFNRVLSFANSATEKKHALRVNKNIRSSLYPLTKQFLQANYLNTDYSNLKKTFKRVDCAADVYSYFLMSYGYTTGSPSGSPYASGAGSSGLNPFFGLDADLGFNFGRFGSWLWLLLIAGGFIYLSKDK